MNYQNCYLLSQSFKQYQKQFLEFYASSDGSAVMNLPEMQETWVQSLGQKTPPGERNDNPLQYSCLENSMDRGECHATVHGVRKLTQLCTVESAYAHSHTLCNKYLLPSSIGIL